MKKTLKTITLSALSLAAAFGLMVQVASAGYYDTPTSLNEHNADCPTVMIANHTTQAGSGSDCWATSIPTVQPGDIINVMVYYHNTGYSTAHDVRVRLNNPAGYGSSFNFSGSVTDQEGDRASDSVSINLSSAQDLVVGTVTWFPEQSDNARTLPNGQTGKEIFTSAGLSLGNMSQDTVSGYTNQGTVIIAFKAGTQTCNNCPHGDGPTVETYTPINRDDDRGEITIRGYFDSNGSDTETWFEYRRNGGSWIKTDKVDQGISEHNISEDLEDLSDGEYDYRAVAENEIDIAYGDILSFDIDRDDGGDPCENDDSKKCCDYHGTCCEDFDECCDDYGDDCEDIEVETRPADDIDEDSAELVGYLNEVGSGNVERWFEWSDDKNDVEDGDGSTLRLSGDTDSRGEFSKQLSNLDEDETYYFRACAEDDDGNDDCGSIKSFTTDEEEDDDDNSCKNNYSTRCCNYHDTCKEDTKLPSITTLNPVSIGSTVTTVDGYYNANGCSVTTWFEYGRTNSLGSFTNQINRGEGSGSMTYSFTSLAPNMTYYYAAVGRNCEGTVRGAVKTFTTGGTTVINPPVVITTNYGSGNPFIKLMIDNHRDTVRGGSEIAYDVAWENITRSTLHNLVLQVNFEDMIVIDTDRGDIARDGKSIIYEIEDLGPLESGELTVVTTIKGTLEAGDPVVAQAIMAFENPKTNAAENAIAYDSDEFSVRTDYRASLWGLGFLPNSLVGWLLLLLVILIIILIARSFMRDDRNQVIVNPIAPQYPPAPAPAGDDYIVYRPNPKQ